MALGIVAKLVLAWFSILALAIANGTLREADLIPKLGQVPGLVQSGARLSMLILCVMLSLSQAAEIKPKDGMTKDNMKKSVDHNVMMKDDSMK